MTVWRHDPAHGPWILTWGTAGDVFDLPDGPVVFETADDAQRYADEWNQQIDFSSFRLIPRRVGWLRPSA